MKKMKLFIASAILLAMSVFVFVPVSTVGAAGALDAVCADTPESAVCDNKDDATEGFVGSIIALLLFIVGALSVLAIIIGGILYITSQGSSGSVSKAKNTILYAVIGLIASFIAYALVYWVFNLF